ncbi:BTB POZ fold protein [Rutstroemia sp. NJR-2017a WRK4]|nr:BTB POZ fold protein [Rutstroemia sp. NJR-2017a WRK4]
MIPNRPTKILLRYRQLLSLCSQPEVKIHIGSASHEYRLPGALLCTQVPRFAAIFKEEHFREGAELSATLEEVDGVVSTLSVEMLVQCVCHNRIVFSDSPPQETIAALIEFARLADMYNITGLDLLMPIYIDQIILAYKPDPKSVFVTPPGQDMC